MLEKQVRHLREPQCLGVVKALLPKDTQKASAGVATVVSLVNTGSWHEIGNILKSPPPSHR